MLEDKLVMNSPCRTRLGLFVLLVSVGCSSSTSEPDPEPEIGSIMVTVTTTGVSLDADGYTATLGSRTQAVDVNGTTTLTGVATGSQSVMLDGIAGNCTVMESNPQTVTVAANQTVTLTFTVVCTRVLEAVTLLATDRTGAVYIIDETTGDATVLFTPTTDDGAGTQIPIGVISSMVHVWSTDTWWLGFGGQSACFGCLHTLDPETGLSTFLSDPSSTIRAVAGLAVHPITGRIYTSEGDSGSDLFELDPATGAISVAVANINDPGTGKGMTFSNDGLLYIGGSNELVTVDVDGAGTVDLGAPVLTGFPVAVTSSTIRSMATRESDGTVFVITRDGKNDPAEIATMNLTTGELTHVGTNVELLDGLAFIPTRLLIGAAAPVAPSR